MTALEGRETQFYRFSELVKPGSGYPDKDAADNGGPAQSGCNGR